MNYIKSLGTVVALATLLLAAPVNASSYSWGEAESAWGSFMDWVDEQFRPSYTVSGPNGSYKTYDYSAESTDYRALSEAAGYSDPTGASSNPLTENRW